MIGSSRVNKLPDQSLSKMVAQTFGVRLDSEEFNFIFSSTLSYLSGYCTAFEYQHAIKPYTIGLRVSAKSFRLGLHAKHYLYLQIKMFLFHLGMHRSLTDEIVDSLRVSDNICRCDARRIVEVWVVFSKLRSHIKRTIREIPNDMRHLLDIAEAQRFFNSIYLPVFKYVRSITYQKLRFVAKSTNYELGDLQNEVMLKVASAFYTMLPIRITEAHVVNYLKRCAHNSTMNIIDAETTQKRGRLVNVGGVTAGTREFSLLVMSENQMAINPDNPDASYDDLSPDDGQMQKFELEFSVSEILTRYKKFTKKYRLLCLLMGKEDAEFTEFLRFNGLCRDCEDNTEAQLRMSVPDFYAAVSKFLRVKESKVNIFMLKIAKSLAMPINENAECKYG